MVHQGSVTGEINTLAGDLQGINLKLSTPSKKREEEKERGKEKNDNNKKFYNRPSHPGLIAMVHQIEPALRLPRCGARPDGGKAL
jgi:hypothetical protein